MNSHCLFDPISAICLFVCLLGSISGCATVFPINSHLSIKRMCNREWRWSSCVVVAVWGCAMFADALPRLSLAAAPGELTSAECLNVSYCGALNDTCCIPGITGSSTSTFVSLRYNSSTGVFNGSILTNRCPAYASEFLFNGSFFAATVQPACVRQSFPASSFPAPLPLNTLIGIALRSGEAIRSLLPQALLQGSACSNGFGSCSAGMDEVACSALLEQSCGSTGLTQAGMLSGCESYGGVTAAQYDPGAEGLSRYFATSFSSTCPVLCSRL